MPFKSSKEFKVKDFIKALMLLERSYQSPLGNNPNMVAFLKGLRNELISYGELNGEVFLEVLKKSLNTDKTLPNYERKITINTLDINSAQIDDLRVLLLNKNLTKDQLLDIAQLRFGISRGTHERLNKKELQEVIEKAMQNVETLQIIANKASS